jgi:hypothetical protein
MAIFCRVERYTCGSAGFQSDTTAVTDHRSATRPDALPLTARCEVPRPFHPAIYRFGRKKSEATAIQAELEYQPKLTPYHFIPFDSPGIFAKSPSTKGIMAEHCSLACRGSFPSTFFTGRTIRSSMGIIAATKRTRQPNDESPGSPGLHRIVSFILHTSMSPATEQTRGVFDGLVALWNSRGGTLFQITRTASGVTR